MAYQPPSVSSRRTAGRPSQLPIEFGQIRRSAAADLSLGCLSALEPTRKRQLDRSVHGKKRVRNYLETIERGSPLGAGCYNPGGLHLRQPCNLAQTADHKDRHSIRALPQSSELVSCPK